MNNKPKLLRSKPGRDPDRRQHQAQVKHALIEGQVWGLTYILAHIINKTPYDNYTLPDSLEELEFTLKGALRIEMLNQTTYKGWRRLFGSNTKAHDISTWRSRVMLKAFPNLKAACRFIKNDPLWQWQEKSSPVLPTEFPPDDWYVVLQVQDIWIEIDEAKHKWQGLWSKWLARSFWKKSPSKSAFLRVIWMGTALSPIKGENHA